MDLGANLERRVAGSEVAGSFGKARRTPVSTELVVGRRGYIANVTSLRSCTCLKALYGVCTYMQYGD